MYRAAQLALVSILDSLLSETDANGMTCRGVLLDGQTSMLDDYLQLRPESSPDLQAAILAHHLEIGPWYVPPAEYLVQGEALIRNLASARRHASNSELLSTALLASTNGHSGQMPQILQGFGIEGAVTVVPMQERAAVWNALDGSTVILAHLLQGDLTSPQEMVAQAQSLLLAEENVGSALAVLYPVSEQPWSTALSTAISDAQRTTRSMHLTVGSVSDHVRRLQDTRDMLPTLHSEIIAHDDAGMGLLTARGWIKQQSHLVETLLSRWAEPFVAWADFLSADQTKSQSTLLNFAWDSVLEIHAPEMIGGLHLDETAQEILLKLRTAEELANGIAQSSLAIIGTEIASGELIEKCTTRFVVFNATTTLNTDSVTFFTSVPASSVPFELIDSEGGLPPFQVETISEADDQGLVDVELNLAAFQMPPTGYRAYGLRPSAASLPLVQEDTGDAIENEYLNLSFSPSDGTVKLFDKRTGRSFNQLNRYVDGGDAGDLNQYAAPARDTFIDIATNTPLRITRRVGPSEQRLETFQIYRIPRSLNETRDSRVAFAAQFVPISIWTTMRLKYGVPRVDIDVLVSNAALDHRLRVHFPTGVFAEDAYFDGHFEVLKRSLPQDPMSYPQQAFVSVVGGSTGITLANRGLREVEIAPTTDGLELALTLLRCVGTLDGLPTPDAQCIGDFAFAYSLIPHADDPLPAWREAWNFQTPLAAKAISTANGSLPPAGSLVASDNPHFVISAIKWAGNRSISMRGYNLVSTPQLVNLDFGIAAVRATRTRLDESPVEKPHKLTKQRLTFVAAPHAIVTYRVDIRVQ